MSFGGMSRVSCSPWMRRGPRKSAKPIIALLQSGRLPADREIDLWVLLARIATPAEIDFILDPKNLDRIRDEEQMARVMSALEESVRNRKIRPSKKANDRAENVTLFVDSSNPKLKVSAWRLCGHWKLEGMRCGDRPAVAESKDSAQRKATLHRVSCPVWRTEFDRLAIGYRRLEGGGLGATDRRGDIARRPRSRDRRDVMPRPSSMGLIPRRK